MLYVLLLLVNFMSPGQASTETLPAVYIELSHEKVVVDLSEEVSIKCTTNATELEKMGWTALDKLIIERENENGPPKKLASIDHAQAIRGQTDNVVVEGRVEKDLTAWLKMTYQTAEDETEGNMRCLVTGYDNYYEANWLEDFTPYAMINATDVSIEAVMESLKHDKRILKETGQTISDASKWVQTFSKYLNEWNSRTNMYLEHWPNGNYALPKPTTGCPADMPIPWTTKTSQFTLARGKRTENKLPYHFEQSGPNIVKYSFCRHESGGHYSWPEGDYCIHPYTVSSRCPTDFEISDIVFGHLDSASDSIMLKAAIETSLLKSASRGREYLTIRFCCRNDGPAKNPVLLPTQAPFYLYQGQSGVCQEIVGANYSIEELTHNVRAPKSDSSARGAASKHEKDDGIIRLCYYTGTGPHNYEEESKNENFPETTVSPEYLTTSSPSQKIKERKTKKPTIQTTTTEPTIEPTIQEKTSQAPTESTKKVADTKELKTPLPLILSQRHFNDPKKIKVHIPRSLKSQKTKKPKRHQEKKSKTKKYKPRKRRVTKTKRGKHTKKTSDKKITRPPIHHNKEAENLQD
ncbi:uncharacterized protein LOC131951637 [Physella acuta]|uniref:uncharacterized protein LOC131951637 n=1 Tax=Physella acuta TaxID=109671 RepID=UPI0027DC31F1|nr:uncharacterized protein LOC131951637 [Physella acuta]